MVYQERFWIRITKAPDAPAFVPMEISEAWVGVEMVAERLPEDAEEIDFITGENKGNRGGYLVNVEEALSRLRERSRNAAGWFRAILLEDIPSLTFGPDEAEIVPKEEIKQRFSRFKTSQTD